MDFTHSFPRCNPEQLQPHFLELLKRLEYITTKCHGMKELVITSGYRSLDWEISHKRNGSSSHIKGLAVDIACTDSSQRLYIVDSALSIGINRIGISKSFIHLDFDKDKFPCIWLY